MAALEILKQVQNSEAKSNSKNLLLNLVGNAFLPFPAKKNGGESVLMNPFFGYIQNVIPFPVFYLLTEMFPFDLPLGILAIQT